MSPKMESYVNVNILKFIRRKNDQVLFINQYVLDTILKKHLKLKFDTETLKTVGILIKWYLYA